MSTPLLMQLLSLVSIMLSQAAAEPQPTCGYPMGLTFCKSVTYNVSMTYPAGFGDEPDKDARLKYEKGLRTFGHCKRIWKAMQCANKFRKCNLPDTKPQKICKSLCVEFGLACNGSMALLDVCNDNNLYSDPPCVDYVAEEDESSATAVSTPFWIYLSQLLLLLAIRSP